MHQYYCNEHAIAADSTANEVSRVYYSTKLDQGQGHFYKSKNIWPRWRIIGKCRNRHSPCMWETICVKRASSQPAAWAMSSQGAAAASLLPSFPVREAYHTVRLRAFDPLDLQTNHQPMLACANLADIIASRNSPIKNKFVCTISTNERRWGLLLMLDDEAAKLGQGCGDPLPPAAERQRR